MEITKQMNTIGSRMRRRRVALNWSQAKLSNILLLPVSSISAYECDHVDMKASTICQIAEALGVSPGYLFGDNEGNESCLSNIKDEEIRQQIEILICLLAKKGI